MSEELKQRNHQINKRLATLTTESDASYKTLEETEQRIKEILNASTLIEITAFGIADHRPPSETLENELNKFHDIYLQNFSFYLFNANLISRLEARAKGIGKALLNGDTVYPSIHTENHQNKEELTDWYDQNRRKKRIGSQASTNGTDSISTTNNTSQASPRRRRPRLFGGSLEEYVEATGEQIPLVVTSCIRVLSQYALHHQGVFRITPLMNKLPRSTYLLLRYLFAFLNHLSEFSDENMMCFSNLAICFGPTLLRIPEGKDQVFYQNYVNEVVKNLIMHCDSIFSSKIPGPRYQKYDHANATLTTTTTTTENNRDIEMFMDDNDEFYKLSDEISFNRDERNFENENSSLFKPLNYSYPEFRETVLNDGMLDSYQKSNNQMNSSTLSSNTIIKNFNNMNIEYGSRLPPDVTATLLKSGMNRNTNTYCYSSSDENCSTANLENLSKKVNVQAPITVEDLEKQLTFKENLSDLIQKQEDSKYDFMQHNSLKSNLNEKVDNNGKENSSATQKISTSTTTNIRNMPISNSVVQAVAVNATKASAIANNNHDNYASILGKAERIRIPMQPHSNTTTSSNTVMPHMINSQASDAFQTRTIKTVDVLVGAPPSYNMLYGNQKAKPSPTSSISSPTSVQSTTLEGGSENILYRNPHRSNSSMSQQTGKSSLNSSPSRRPKPIVSDSVTVKPDLVSNLPPIASQPKISSNQ